jgi:hypothetical protein
MYGIIAAMVLHQAALTFTTIAQGQSGQIEDTRQVVIRSATEWQTLWRRHSAEPVPPVDFSRSVVIGIFLGSRPTAGYGVTITRVSSQGEKTIVEYVERRPDADAIVAQVITSPFHLVTVAQPGPEVEFRRAEPPDDKR